MSVAFQLTRCWVVFTLTGLGLWGWVALAQAAPAVGETCFATPNNGTTVYSSTTAQAVRDAVGAVAVSGTVKVAGYCPGVQTQSGTAQTVLITQSLTLAGGYTLTNWSNADPVANPTTLDALGAGRVLSANANLNLLNLKIQNGFTTNLGGGGLYARQATAITNVQFLSNTALSGGGLYAIQFVTLTNVSFYTNASTNGFGGGAVALGGAWVSGGVFQNNQCAVTSCRGGGLYGHNVGTVSISGTQFISNTATGAGLGGGVGMGTGTPLTLTNTQFTSNTAASGGGVYGVGVLTILNSGFTANRANSGSGGAVMAVGALNITNTVFHHNQTLTTTQGGGAIYATGGGRVVNSLFNANRVGGGAGLALLAAGGTFHLLHNTIVSPSVAVGASVVVSAGGLNITNTVFASHTVGLARSGGTAVENFNLFANVTTPYSGSVASGGSSLTGTAAFYNTSEYTLTASSAAIDAGTDLGVATDYFGALRPQGVAPEMGYFEAPAASFIITPTAGANGSITPSTPQTVPVGESRTFTITPSLGHFIAEVRVDGVAVGTPSIYTFTNVTANHVITAAFAPNLYTLTVATAGTGSGVVTPTTGVYTHPYGSVITLTATPNAGSTFTGWSGDCSGTGDCVVPMTQARSVTAHFAAYKQYLPFIWR